MRNELFRVFEDVKYNPEVWIATLTGTGRAFCVGHDLTEMSAAEDGGPPTDDLYLYQLGVFKPLVASINGFCLAQGAELVLCSDVRIASEQAQLGWPQVKRGKEAALRGAGMQVAERVRFASLLLKWINQTADAQEGLAAFREKRQPSWQGR
jgi:enoyl-CoA hydratase/carnithine racemase